MKIHNCYSFNTLFSCVPLSLGCHLMHSSSTLSRHGLSKVLTLAQVARSEKVILAYFSVMVAEGGAEVAVTTTRVGGSAAKLEAELQKIGDNIFTTTDVENSAGHTVDVPVLQVTKEILEAVRLITQENIQQHTAKDTMDDLEPQIQEQMDVGDTHERASERSLEREENEEPVSERILDRIRDVPGVDDVDSKADQSCRDQACEVCKATDKSATIRFQICHSVPGQGYQ